MSFLVWIVLLIYICAFAGTAYAAAVDHQPWPFALTTGAGLAFWVWRRS